MVNFFRPSSGLLFLNLLRPPTPQEISTWKSLTVPYVLRLPWSVIVKQYFCITQLHLLILYAPFLFFSFFYNACTYCSLYTSVAYFTLLSLYRGAITCLIRVCQLKIFESISREVSCFCLLPWLCVVSPANCTCKQTQGDWRWPPLRGSFSLGQLRCRAFKYS